MASLRLAIVIFVGTVVIARPTFGAEEPAPPLAKVLERARAESKPVLLEFGAVWCVPCRFLEKELESQEIRDSLRGFVFQKYDVDRGEGSKAAATYHVQTFPTLLLIDAAGAELLRSQGYQPGMLKDWLGKASIAGTSEDQVKAALAKSPNDTQLLWNLVGRARTRGDSAKVRELLARIEAADKSPHHDEAARAAWARLEDDLRGRIQQSLQPLLADYVQKYPAQGGRALKLLAAAGASRDQLEKAFARVINQTDSAALNELVYDALDTGALDAALTAAEKQVHKFPTANSYDSLAEVYNYRGDKEHAVATEEKALASHPAPQEEKPMRANLERFRKGQRLPDATKPTLASLFPSERRPMNLPPEFALRRLLQTEAMRVAEPCRSKAPKDVDEIYVRIRVGTTPRIERVELLEPSASPEFRKCIEKAIREIAVPADSQPTTTVVALLPRQEKMKQLMEQMMKAVGESRSD